MRLRAKRIMRETRWGEREGKEFRNSNSWVLPPRKEKMWGLLWRENHVTIEYVGNKFSFPTILGNKFLFPRKRIFVLVLVRSIFGHDSLTIWSQPHLSNPTKGRGAKCIPIAYHRLVHGYWRFSISRWKNTLRLKSRHTSALSLKRLRERSYTRTTHSKH